VLRGETAILVYFALSAVAAVVGVVLIARRFGRDE
jgi:hypothetical protein